MLPNVGHQIVHVKITGIARSLLILYVNRLRVKGVMKIYLQTFVLQKYEQLSLVNAVTCDM